MSLNVPRITTGIQVFIEEIIQSDPVRICRGRLSKWKIVFVKEPSSRVSLEREMNINSRLHQQNVLSYIMDFQMDGKDYIAMEPYENTLSKFLEEKSAEKKLNASIIKDIMRQLWEVMRYLHEKMVAHGQLKMENIVIVVEDNKLICKITNFSEYLIASRITFREDVMALKLIFKNLCEAALDGRRTYENGWEKHDNILCNDLINKLNDIYHMRAWAIRNIFDHPIFLTPRETINLVVQIAKMLENKHDKAFESIITKDQDSVFMSDWTAIINPELEAKLTAEKREHFNLRAKLRKDIIGLIKTIRNLVTICQVFSCESKMIFFNF